MGGLLWLCVSSVMLVVRLLLVLLLLISRWEGLILRVVVVWWF